MIVHFSLELLLLEFRKNGYSYKYNSTDNVQYSEIVLNAFFHLVNKYFSGDGGTGNS